MDGGSTLMELRLGAPVLLGDTPEVMISSVVHGRPRLAASIFPRLLTHADWTRSIPHSPAGPRRGHAQKCQKLLANATRLMRAGLPENQKHTTAQYSVQCYYMLLHVITYNIPGTRGSTPEQPPHCQVSLSVSL